MTDKPIYNKKRWLLRHAELIQSLKQGGMTNKQIIEHLKNSQNMPFELDESLFSRHCRAVFEQLDLEKINATLTSKIQSLEKYNYYLEGSNKSLLLQNRELSKPKPIAPQPEPLPVKPANDEYINDLKRRLAQKQQRLEQVQATIEQQETTIRELQGRLEQAPEKPANDSMRQQNIALKRDIRRLESLLAEGTMEAALVGRKLDTAQNRAKQSMYLAYCFLAISIILLLYIAL